MRLPHVTSLALLVAFVFCSVWLALVVISPFLVPHGILEDLSGRVSYRDNTAIFSDLDPLPKAIYSIGDVECHQIKERSYFLNGNEMPFCARDFGLFIGLTSGFGLVAFYRVKLNPFFLLLGLIPMGVDGGLQLITDYESNNPLRLATGILAGVALAVLIAVFALTIQNDRKKVARPLAKE